MWYKRCNAWCRLQFQKLAAKASPRIKEHVLWWVGATAPVDATDLRKSLASAGFDPNRIDDLLAFAKDSYTDAIAGLKLANERIEKLIVGVLIACGWIFSTSKTSPTLWQTAFWFLTSVAFIFAIATLLFGRWRVLGRTPGGFSELAARSRKIPSEDNAKWKWHRSRQYAIAAFETQQLTGLVHKRLFIAVTSMVIGLVLYALRGV